MSEAENSSPLQASDRSAPLVQGSLWGAIWIMSWPTLLMTISSSIVGMADLQVAGFLGSAQQAAVGVCEHIIFLFVIFILSISVGTTALVSRAYGANDMMETVRATSQSIIIALTVSVALALIAVSISPFIVVFSTRSLEVLVLAEPYLRIYAFYLIPFSVINIINVAFRAIGDAKTPLIVVSSMTVLNVAGDYTLVIGNWPVAGLGIKGIALSGLIACSIGSMIAVLKLKHSPLANSVVHLLPIDLALIGRVLKVGVPSACQRMSWALSIFVLFFILSRCQSPTQALASWTVGMRIEALLFMPLLALSLAVSSIVGQSLGAQDFKRAFRAGWHVAWIGIWMMAFLSVALFLLAEPIAKLMSHDPQTITYTKSYLRINALAEPFLALGMILSGALQGAGDTRPPMWISIFANWIIRLPLAWLMALILGYGPTGAWISMTISVILTGFLVMWRYQSRAWIKVKV